MRRGAVLVAIALLAAAAAAQAESPWERLRESARGWLGGAEDPAAAIARIGGLRVLLRPDLDDFRNTLARELHDDIRRLLGEAGIAHGALDVHDGSVELQLREPADTARAMSALAALAGRAHAVDIRQAGPDMLRLAPADRVIADRLNAPLDQSVAVIGRRLEGSGLASAGVRREGPDRIVVIAPGLTDPAQLARITAPTALLEFRLVDVSMTPNDALRSGAPAGAEVLYDKTRRPYLVRKQSGLGGADIADATPGFDQNNRPDVNFSFNARGGRAFGQLTQENVGRPIAIVLDGEVLSAPVIQTPILGGHGAITGNFTVAEAKRLAVLLRAGTLPLKLLEVEHTIVSPSKN
jgi:preprotein translocase subunit SecD